VTGVRIKGPPCKATEHREREGPIMQTVCPEGGPDNSQRRLNCGIGEEEALPLSSDQSTH
jgi:hypothetical protein